MRQRVGRANKNTHLEHGIYFHCIIASTSCSCHQFGRPRARLCRLVVLCCVERETHAEVVRRSRIGLIRSNECETKSSQC